MSDDLIAKQSRTSDKLIIKSESAAFKATKTYSLTFETYLKDSNAYGNIYFSRHFEWQGVMRESWFSKCIFEGILELKGSFVTKVAHIDYMKETFPFQRITGVLNSRQIKATSGFLDIKFYNDQDKSLVSSGYQKIVYVNAAKKITRLPDSIRKKIQEYEI